MSFPGGCYCGLLAAGVRNLPAFLVSAGDVKEAPLWAKNQLDGLAAWERALEACLEKFVDESTGKVCAEFHHGTADDVAEAFAVWDHVILLRGNQRLGRGYVKIWEWLYDEMFRRKIFTSGFYRGDYDAKGELALASERSRAFYRGGYDAEHAGELLQLLYGALEMDPTNPKLIEAVCGVANVMMGPCWNPETRLLRHQVLSSSGGRGEPYDTIDNTIYTLAGFYAYLATGQEKYRRWVLEYVESWNQLAELNGGVFPYRVRSDTREIPQEWWSGGPFAYDRGIGVAVRAIHGWAPAVACLAPARRSINLRAVETFVDTLFRHGQNGLPANSMPEGKWKRRGDPWTLVKLVDRPYVLRFQRPAAERIRKYYQHASGAEKEFLRWANFTYFGGEDMDYVAKLFANRKASADRLRQRVLALGPDQLPRTGDEVANFTKRTGLEQCFVDGAFWGLWENGRCGGASTASIRYWRPDGAIGLPEGVAALVRHVGKEELHLFFYNARQNATTVRLTAGYYGQHRFEGASCDGKPEVKVGGRRLDVVVAARSLAKLKLRLTRYAYPPTLEPLKVPAEH